MIYIDFGNNPFKSEVSFYVPHDSKVLTWNGPMIISARVYNEDVNMDIGIGLIEMTDMYKC